jgi:uncharacterized protein with von Willebrand factor type A (vWA) domain
LAALKAFARFQVLCAVREGPWGVEALNRRIASSLGEFARVHARAQLRRGARVWIMSDGFDTDAPEHLAEALRALRGHGARITWFHPTRQEPAAAAVLTAREHIHRFIPLASLADLAAARPVLC